MPWKTSPGRPGFRPPRYTIPTMRCATPTLPTLLLTLAGLTLLLPGGHTTAGEPPDTLILPESRDTRVPLPDVALPLADPETPGRVSLADLAGEKYILHVFASW